MNTLRFRIPAALLGLALSAWIADVNAQPVAPPTDPASSATATAPAAPVDSNDDEQDSQDRKEDRHDARDDRWDDRWDDQDRSERHAGHRRHGDNLVNFGSDSVLPKDQHADSVVSILGSSSVEGEAREAVSVFGNTRIGGPIRGDAIAVFGGTYVDSTVGGDVVAVLGNVQLGPHAVVGHNVVAVGGKVKRDPAASVGGSVQSVGGVFDWVHPWIEHCLFYARPLAIAPGLGWAWGLALTFLALYLCLALLFREAVDRCVQTLEMRPGASVLAALLTVLLVPVLFVLLCITFVGVAAIPVVVLGLFCAGLFGKAVMLAWIGRRILGARREGPIGHTASAVLIGGVIVLVLYLVPVLGFVLYKLLGLLGLGAVVYTLTGLARERRDAKYAAAPAGPAPAAPVGPAPVGPAPVGPAPVGPAPVEPAPVVATPAGATPAAAAPTPAAPMPAAPMPAAPMPAAPVVTASLPRAGFWVRMVALLLDTILIGVLMSMVHHLVHLELLALAAYGAIMWKMRGATIGGIVFDLQVVRLDGRPVDWETAIVRALGCFLSMAVAGLGFFWIAFDHQKQAWHDKIAGTVVVRVAKGVPLV